MAVFSPNFNFYLQITGFVASYGAGSVAGYALASKDRILAVYTESTETAS